MTEEEKLREREIFSEIWAIRKAFYNPINDDSYWEKCVEAFKKSSERHKSRFVDMLLLACFADLEAKHKVNNLGYPPKEVEEEMFNLWLKLTRS